jgi:hypothetical protein
MRHATSPLYGKVDRIRFRMVRFGPSESNECPLWQVEVAEGGLGEVWEDRPRSRAQLLKAGADIVRDWASRG